MPRIHKNQRLTRSSGRDPISEVIMVLQERIQILERQVRQLNRSWQELEEELAAIQGDFQEFRAAASRERLFVENRRLALTNTNLRNRLQRVEDVLQSLGLVAPLGLDRTYSSFDLS